MDIRLKLADALTYAGAQNFIPTIQSLELVNDGEASDVYLDPHTYR